ncbi:hypothetical protein [Halanaeroarchaeum sulfurireducens]|uniref:Uncharacterized protein n=1 Tax=Halanaeroarchaeum sulfurireducens TaxID=1604004 RepID=A0A0F7PCQ5_9EURY|nr:hypothetical protein [Halanaeroarchaeum sulfurireducens]AKH97960.1 hypothetical protein HLASF_1480 [Halanaeroarchaeum sulfurireducens]ALG82354.1 hypothetical protein HLASA_1467 [Halanaeroarchaeum sulfurireducens]
MRTYRFVRFLGDRVEAASRDIAANAATSREPAERLTGDQGDPHEAVRRALPRTVATHVDGASRAQTRFRATTVATDDSTAIDPDLGVLIHVSVPDFEQVTGLVAKTVDARALGDPEYSLAETNESEALDRLLAITADAFVFVVGEQRVHVVPAQSVASLTDPQKRQTPHHDLYSRQLGRTFEELAEGFLGDGRISPSLSETDSRSETKRKLRSWAADNDLEQALALRVTATEKDVEATLQDFAT